MTNTIREKIEKQWKVARGSVTVTIYGRVGDSPDWSVKLPKEMWDDLMSDVEALINQEKETVAQNKKVEIQETLLAYTDWLEKYGYVDSDVWSETPSAINRFLATLRENPPNQVRG